MNIRLESFFIKGKLLPIFVMINPDNEEEFRYP